MIPTPARPVTIIEFADLECPACRHFELGTLADVRQKYGSNVRSAFVHFPLSNHRYARPAAKAAECAHEQGKFQPFIEAVYKTQDSLGTKSWMSYALEAGVGDSSRYKTCLDGPGFARIDSGYSVAERLELPGTPTVMVNGWRFDGVPTVRQLSEVIDALLAGRKPRI